MVQQKIPSPNIWQLKPWWCQPWSIVLTGIGLIGGSWWLGGQIWAFGQVGLTLLVSLPVIAWMVYFLWVYPRLMAEFLQAEFLQADKNSQPAPVEKHPDISPDISDVQQPH